MILLFRDLIAIQVMMKERGLLEGGGHLLSPLSHFSEVLFRIDVI